MNFLLDTCVISDFFKKIPAVIKRFQAVSPQQIHVSTLSVMEVEYGLKLNPERIKKLIPLWKELLELVVVVPYSPECAIATAVIRAELKQKGLLMSPYDILIAGTALAQDMTLVTSNTSEFTRIHSLTIDDWRL